MFYFLFEVGRPETSHASVAKLRFLAPGHADEPCESRTPLPDRIWRPKTSTTGPPKTDLRNLTDLHVSAEPIQVFSYPSIMHVKANPRCSSILFPLLTLQKNSFTSPWSNAILGQHAD